MEDSPRILMEKASRILRKSIYTFLQNYQYLTATAAVLAFPYSASILLSQVFVPSSPVLPTVHNRLRILFQAAGFPPSSDFFTILSLKISQTISSCIFTLPFTLSFLLIAKSSIIQLLNQHKPNLPPSFSSVCSLYKPLLATHICNFLLLVSANATAFSLLFFAFNFLEGFGFSSPNWLLFLSAAGAVLYSIILANALIVCNLALISSGMERSSGYMAILKACVLIRGRTSTALTLAVPVSLVLGAIEALFHYRVVRAYHTGNMTSFPTALEGILIAYLYSTFIVLDTVVSCMFFKSCKTGSLRDLDSRYSYRVEIAEEDGNAYVELKNIEELP
ncbi:uncharacterized protein LOC111275034 [Durio zibethinus]|uniref:Uncharacterized protein LOC111275034 n=1 Tax=Durio zibethinus TaxID=66656 RepID=A0A6P5WI99_DURZI|nr:uncharacterized protein LOC111275034 [Durio zibethinus]